MIYLTNISELKSEALLPYVSSERAEYASKYKKEPDRVRSLAAEILLRGAIKREYPEFWKKYADRKNGGFCDL